MKKYIDKVEIQNFKEINEEILEWKTFILKRGNIRIYLWTLWVARILFVISLILLFIFWFVFYFLHLRESENSQLNYPAIITYSLIFDFSLLLISIILWIIYYHNWWTLIDEGIEKQGINPYTKWLEKINKNLIIDRNIDLYMPESKFKDYKKMTYVLLDMSQKLIKEYEIIHGVFFNNPFELSCGVWDSSSSNSQGTKSRSLSYAPLLKIRTNLFLDEIVIITNSIDFENFTEEDIQFENEEFNKIFSVRASNENVARMILTPIVQNRWTDMKYLPPFNMYIEGGFIKVVFKSGQFMDMKALAKLPYKKFKNVDLLIWNDISNFISILELVFSISIFQFEEMVDFDNLTFD